MTSWQEAERKALEARGLNPDAPDALSETRSKVGKLGLHLRWHVQRGRPNLVCEFCQVDKAEVIACPWTRITPFDLLPGLPPAAVLTGVVPKALNEIARQIAIGVIEAPSTLRLRVIVDAANTALEIIGRREEGEL